MSEAGDVVSIRALTPLWTGGIDSESGSPYATVSYMWLKVVRGG